MFRVVPEHNGLVAPESSSYEVDFGKSLIYARTGRSGEFFPVGVEGGKSFTLKEASFMPGKTRHSVVMEKAAPRTGTMS